MSFLFRILQQWILLPVGGCSPVKWTVIFLLCLWSWVKIYRLDIFLQTSGQNALALAKNFCFYLRRTFRKMLANATGIFVPMAWLCHVFGGSFKFSIRLEWVFFRKLALTRVPIVVLGLEVCLLRMFRMSCILFGFPNLVVCSYTRWLTFLELSYFQWN